MILLVKEYFDQNHFPVLSIFPAIDIPVIEMFDRISKVFCFCFMCLRLRIKYREESLKCDP